MDEKGSQSSSDASAHFLALCAALTFALEAAILHVHRSTINDHPRKKKTALQGSAASIKCPLEFATSDRGASTDKDVPAADLLAITRVREMTDQFDVQVFRTGPRDKLVPERQELSVVG